jgi:hypothetical protein
MTNACWLILNLTSFYLFYLLGKHSKAERERDVYAKDAAEQCHACNGLGYTL